ncbi:MAG: serine/threonine-protein kinase [Nocardioidaceae bacterium]
MPESAGPTKVGAYELLARIGEGGMGVVHLAEAPDGRRVAIKLLRPHVVGDDQGRARMAREVTSLRRVRSQRVAEVYDADPWGDTPYVVTRYVPGLSLHDHVEQRGRISGEDLVVFARGLAEALVAVHLADVLHRDVKPSNVLIEGRNPVLIDFGLAQLSDDSKLTHSGWLLGTPGYLAPEILYGDDPTPKADVHSWAATVVFAATARGPYGKGPAIAVMDRVRRGEYDLSGVPESIDWMVRRALLPDPRERPAAGELVEWMTPLLPSQPQAYAGPAERRPEPTAHEHGVAERPSTPTYSPKTWTAPGRPSYVASLLLWMFTVALVVVAAVTVPVVAALLVFVGGLLLRTLTLRGRRLEEWRRRRGVRRNDSTVATMCVPWFAMLALPPALVNAGVAVADAAIVVVVTVLLDDPASPGQVLAFAGLVSALFVWWGPLSADVRAGGRIVSQTLLQPGAATIMVLTLVALSAVGLLAIRGSVGPQYVPLPDPPWERSLRNLVR